MLTRTAASLLLLALCAAPAIASVPSPANSSVPSCLFTCPMGDVSATVTVRDFANNPIAASTVVFDFSACPRAFLCGPRFGDTFTINLATRTVSLTTNASGVATFPLRVGGFCDGVKVYANGVLLATRTLKSVDQDGNGVVLVSDDALLLAKMGTSDPSGDFNCDGIVDGTDQLLYSQHGSHSCDGIVNPVERRTWGALKTHYR